MKISNDEFGPEYVLDVYDPVSGMRGYLVIDNLALGPGKGGIRMTANITREEVFALARTMTWKNALAGLPFGGAKAGMVYDPKKHSIEQKKEFVEAFSRALKPMIPKLYIAGPDMNSGETEMQWFAEANGNWKSATGKPANMCKVGSGRASTREQCGIPHEFGSTGFGVVEATVAAAKFKNVTIKGASVAIDGFGNVGEFTAKYLEEMGARVVAVSDSEGAVYREKGFSLKELMNAKQQGSVVKVKNAKIIQHKELFTLPVEILIPASIPDVVNKSNYKDVQAGIIVEGANVPIPHDIEDKLYNKGVLIIPDIIANAGGVISSFAEYRGYNPKDMFALVKKNINQNVSHILETSQQKSITPREAAMDIARARVLGAMKKKKR